MWFAALTILGIVVHNIQYYNLRCLAPGVFIVILVSLGKNFLAIVGVRVNAMHACGHPWN
jgi:hypothetical protein